MFATPASVDTQAEQIITLCIRLTNRRCRSGAKTQVQCCGICQCRAPRWLGPTHVLGASNGLCRCHFRERCRLSKSTGDTDENACSIKEDVVVLSLASLVACAWLEWWRDSELSLVYLPGFSVGVVFLFNKRTTFKSQAEHQQLDQLIDRLPSVTGSWPDRGEWIVAEPGLTVSLAVVDVGLQPRDHQTIDDKVHTR